MKIAFPDENRIILFIFCLMAIGPSAINADEHFTIFSSTDNSNNGGFNLTWQLPVNTQVELQQSGLESPDFKTIYHGSDSATVITGLPDGNYLFRARLINIDGSLSGWSESLSIKVEHHSLMRAFSFFLIGAVVFLSTLILILTGSKANHTHGAPS